MEWTSLLSREIDTARAVEEARAHVEAKLEGPPDFIAVFSSRHHANRQALIPDTLADAFPEAKIAGCAAYSVIGGGEEEEDESALSVTAARMPGVDVTVTPVDSSGDPGWLEAMPDDAEAMMLVVDAFSTDAEALIRELDRRYPGVPKFGGFASGGVYPGSNALYGGGQVVRQGSVVVTFSGTVSVETIVAQGCRPIGEPFVVLRHQNNMILELDKGRPAAVLQQVYERLPAEDRALIPDSLHVGIEMHDRPDGVYRRGDFLVRPLVSIDPNSGALTIGGRLRGNEVVQFHLRDARASTDDLTEWLEQYEPGDEPVRGALLFSCVARGVDLFGVPNHDTRLFLDEVGDVPIGGFFCSREIGPVRDETFIHGYTSTFVMFRPGASG